ncbi:MAG: ribonuclease Z [Deltaproteobacteria bacterium]|nr:MAG: ribonuclease Z [Deltaproteobacteria bacterium]
MRPAFLPRLVNSPFGDPGLYLSFAFQRQAVLFDAGDLSALSSRDILKIDNIFISHTHMDHFCGFDQVLRVSLGRNKRIQVFGPDGFISHLSSKLSAYQWNLVDNFNDNLTLVATEITDSCMKTQTFHCRDGFIARDVPLESPFTGILLETPVFNVTAAILDHQIPCLAFSLRERFHVNILKPALTDLGLRPGPWLKTFKDDLFCKRPPETIIEIPASHTTASPKIFSLDELTRKIVRITAGQQVTYVTDAGFTATNQARIIALSDGADHLFIEAAFLDNDRRIAEKKHHLTARQAGYLAARASVKKYTVFHFSPRYSDRADDIYHEARAAFLAGC